MLPANVFLRWVRPYYLVGGAIVCFGTLVCGMSAAETYGALLATRILIGAAQAFVQGIGMYSSLWYTRRELAIRGCKSSRPPGLSGRKEMKTLTQW